MSYFVITAWLVCGIFEDKNDACVLQAVPNYALKLKGKGVTLDEVLYPFQAIDFQFLDFKKLVARWRVLGPFF